MLAALPFSPHTLLPSAELAISVEWSGDVTRQAGPVPATFALPQRVLPPALPELSLPKSIASEVASEDSPLEMITTDRALIAEVRAIPLPVLALPSAANSQTLDLDQTPLLSSADNRPEPPDPLEVRVSAWLSAPLQLPVQFQPLTSANAAPLSTATHSARGRSPLAAGDTIRPVHTQVTAPAAQPRVLTVTPQSSPVTTAAIGTVERTPTVSPAMPSAPARTKTDDAVPPHVEREPLPSLTPGAMRPADFERRVAEPAHDPLPPPPKAARPSQPPAATQRPRALPSASAETTSVPIPPALDESTATAGELPPTAAPASPSELIPQAAVRDIAAPAASHTPALLSDMQEVARQLIEATLARMEVVRRDGPADVAVRLSPPHLGVLHVALQQTEQGWSVQVWAENPATRQLLTEARQEIITGLDLRQPGVQLAFDSRGERGRPDPQELELLRSEEFGRWTAAAQATHAAPDRRPLLSIWA